MLKINTKKENKKKSSIPRYITFLILSIILGAIFTALTSYAATIAATNISYSNTSSGLKATNTQDAIDELFISTPEDYITYGTSSGIRFSTNEEYVRSVTSFYIKKVSDTYEICGRGGSSEKTWFCGTGVKGKDYWSCNGGGYGGDIKAGADNLIIGKYSYTGSSCSPDIYVINSNENASKEFKVSCYYGKWTCCVGTVNECFMGQVQNTSFTTFVGSTPYYYIGMSNDFR